MPTCEKGHQSQAEDWCDVCGHRMQAAATGAAVPPPLHGTGGPQTWNVPDHDATVQAELCPQCRTPRETPQTPYCEECGHNYLGHPTGPTPPGPLQPHVFQSDPFQSDPFQSDPPPSPHPQVPQDWVYQPSRPSQKNRPSEPLAPQHPYSDEDDWVITPPSTPQPVQPVQPAGWVAVIAPDREYFLRMMNKGGPEAASLNLPAYSPEQRLALTGHQITVGRRRHSTGESPDIDLSVPPEDPGVSHQHAMFVQQPDGTWAVVDQDSTNGTTINGSEDPIQPYVPVPLQDGDRVHVGAWTTITVRRG
ncbi:FHA domain-containing protein [Streptomyces morookaense]|uniref:FHA domain-containing protein n=1 Tax=Streptomyces morookaense TaxID=1970 RepID=A0A7Y7B451_STRMO|nr:FHA domain-containing protein [Streptomyces morookaense]NVK78637.1 FHA domain-containing protein [Streptomyces morookaense]GHF44383.1 hypothetical protein GCM10010359_53550 [Streptomyces morookaense]